MSAPVTRTPSGQRLGRWFLVQHNALSSAIDECDTATRQYLEGQLKVLDRVRTQVMRELAYAEVEAIALVTDGATLSTADQYLTDAVGQPT